MTVSNALLKSRQITMTYGFEASKLVTVFRREMRAAVVDPFGRNAN